MPEDFEEQDEKIETGFQLKFIQEIVKIGEVRSLEMNVYEITHQSENDPRISLSRDSFRLLAHYGIKRALILFASQNSPNYRLSLVTIDLKWEEGKRIKKEYSNPRRYSFFLGPETKTHTPETYLIKKGRVKDFDDLKERFSLEIVNKDFYTQIAILFTKLAGGKRTIGKKQFEEKGSLQLPSTSDDTIKKEFSVRLIGRLIFCWFLKKKVSDRGVSLIPEGFLSSNSIAQCFNFYHDVLEPLFFETLNKPSKQRKKEYQLPPWSQIPFLNGGLFMPEYHDYYQVDQLGTSIYINTLKVPDSWLKELFEIFEIYNFTIDENTPVDIELSIEPEMLGRIFENLLAEINPETGNTARKSTGSYYTPRPIVEYMVDESLKQYLFIKTNIDENKISSLLAYEEEKTGLSEPEKDAVIDALDVIKIIDPACGSGAFPMGILQKMLLILQKIDPESKKWLSKKVSRIESSIVRKELQKKIEVGNWNYIHKLGIIQNSIYGVDIQSIAVDISKLRFFLSLIVDEKVDDSKENRGVESLPNLEFKFVCANSLIGLPKKNSQTELFEVDENIRELKRLRDEYFKSYSDEKMLIENKFKNIQNKMFASSLEWLKCGSGDSQTAKLLQWNPFSNEPCKWFDPDWMFGVKDGFDIVIANPPYIEARKLKQVDVDYFRNNFLTAGNRVNTFAFFSEKGITLLSDKGVLTYIIHRNSIRSNDYNKLRKYILDNTSILNILSFKIGVFLNVVGEVTVLITKKTKAKENHLVKIAFCNDTIDNDIFYKVIRQQIFQHLPDYRFNIYLTKEIINLLDRIKENCNLLEQVASITQGIIVGDEKKLITKSKLKSNYRPILRGKNISKYKLLFKNEFINYYPGTKVLTRGKTADLFEVPEKILTQHISSRIIATLDTNQFYYLQTINGIISSDNQCPNKYLLALLNSSVLNFFYEFTFNMGAEFTTAVAIENLSRLPIKKSKSTSVFCFIVEYILTTNASLRSFFERLIDAMVYELYFPDEIKTSDAEVLKHLTNLLELKDDWSDEKKLEVIDKVYKELSDPKHPVSIAMEKQETVPEVRIIEGLDK